MSREQRLPEEVSVEGVGVLLYGFDLPGDRGKSLPVFILPPSPPDTYPDSVK